MASTSSSPSTSRASSNPSSECAGQAFARGRSSTRSAFLGWRHRQPLNRIEPPWYGPVCPVVWEGRSREAPPYPDQHANYVSSGLNLTSDPLATTCEFSLAYSDRLLVRPRPDGMRPSRLHELVEQDINGLDRPLEADFQDLV